MKEIKTLDHFSDLIRAYVYIKNYDLPEGKLLKDRTTKSFNNLLANLDSKSAETIFQVVFNANAEYVFEGVTAEVFENNFDIFFKYLMEKNVVTGVPYLEVLLLNGQENMFNLFKPVLLEKLKNKTLNQQNAFLALMVKYGKEEDIDYLIKNHEKDLKNFVVKIKQNIVVNNISYFTRDFKTLEKLKTITIEPKSLEDWAQKHIYQFLDESPLSTNMYNYKLKRHINFSIERLVTFLKDCQQNNVNIEYYNQKKVNSTATPQMKLAPPLWKFVERNLQHFSQLESFIGKNTYDDYGNNFAQYLLNITRKIPVDTKKNENLEMIKNIISKGGFDLNHKNANGHNTYDMLQNIVKKQSISPKMESYKTFCEKLLLDLSVSGNTQTTKPRSTHKI